MNSSVGEVKEKEKAHKEYKEAISKGHGAYLMDEEEPVSIVGTGNQFYLMDEEKPVSIVGIGNQFNLVLSDGRGGTSKYCKNR